MSGPFCMGSGEFSLHDVVQVGLIADPEMRLPDDPEIERQIKITRGGVFGIYRQPRRLDTQLRASVETGFEKTFADTPSVMPWLDVERVDFQPATCVDGRFAIERKPNKTVDAIGVLRHDNMVPVAFESALKPGSREFAQRIIGEEVADAPPEVGADPDLHGYGRKAGRI